MVPIERRVFGDDVAELSGEDGGEGEDEESVRLSSVALADCRDIKRFSVVVFCKDIRRLNSDISFYHSKKR